MTSNVVQGHLRSHTRSQ